MGVKLPALLVNYDRPTNQATDDGQTIGHREVTLSLKNMLCGNYDNGIKQDAGEAREGRPKN